jgi:phenylalanyl-tRNA synthetase beta chain
VFFEEQEKVQEKKIIGGIMVRPIQKRNNSSDHVFFQTKEIIEVLLNQLSLPTRTYMLQDTLALIQTGEESNILIGTDSIGWIGNLHTAYKKDFDLENSEVTLFELDQNKLRSYQQHETTYEPLPKFPSVRRDIAIVIPKKIPSSTIEKTIFSSHPAISAVELFDVYEGEKIAPDQRSLAYSITCRDDEKTFTSQDIDTIVAHIVSHLGKIGGILRG